MKNNNNNWCMKVQYSTVDESTFLLPDGPFGLLIMKSAFVLFKKLQ